MSFSRTAIILGLSGVLALATLLGASVLYADFNLWVKTLPAAHTRLLAPAFVAISGIFISLGALARRRRHGL